MQHLHTHTRALKAGAFYFLNLQNGGKFCGLRSAAGARALKVFRGESVQRASATRCGAREKEPPGNPGFGVTQTFKASYNP
jgi:hypothetical protein